MKCPTLAFDMFVIKHLWSDDQLVCAISANPLLTLLYLYSFSLTMPLFDMKVCPELHKILTVENFLQSRHCKREKCCVPYQLCEEFMQLSAWIRVFHLKFILLEKCLSKSISTVSHLPSNYFQFSAGSSLTWAADGMFPVSAECISHVLLGKIS